MNSKKKFCGCDFCRFMYTSHKNLQQPTHADIRIQQNIVSTRLNPTLCSCVFACTCVCLFVCVFV
jgi:hypothetical protein